MPPAAAAGAVEGLEDPLALALGDARAAVDDADDDARPDQPRADQDRLALAVDDGVLEQVGEGALELGRVGAERRQLGVERQPHRLAAGADRVPRRLQQPRQIDRLAARLGVPGLQPRDVEQVLDQAREPLALLDHRLAQLVALLGGDAGRVEGGAGGDDRGQRRAQVVGDRAQQRGLQLVAAPQRPGLDRLRLHAVALARQLLQLGQRPVGLLAAALGLGGAGAGQLGQGAAGDGDDREDGQGDEVVVGGDVERPESAAGGTS